MILDVVVNGEHRLTGIMNPGRSNGLELPHDGGRVVMRHDVLGANPDEITSKRDLTGIEANGVGRCDLFDEC